MAKKDYKMDVMREFMSAPEAPEAPQKAQDGANVPKGYVLVRESKSARMQLLVRPTTKEALRRAAGAQGLSVNDLVNQILDNYIEGAGY